MKKVFLFVFIFSSSIAFVEAQILDRKTDPQVLDLFNKAREAQKAENHEAANQYFRQLINTNKKLPKSMAFYFSETLYELKQYQNAYNFIEKYLLLAGRKGDYYEQALALRDIIQKSLKTLQDCNLCDRFGYRKAVCQHCHGKKIIVEECPTCRAAGSIRCPTCKGQGVVIHRNKLGVDEYKTCPTCELKHRIQCPRCFGKKNIESNCPVCFGAGEVSTNQICNHIPLAHGHGSEDVHNHKESLEKTVDPLKLNGQ